MERMPAPVRGTSGRAKNSGFTLVRIATAQYQDEILSFLSRAQGLTATIICIVSYRVESFQT
jgi:hypothetical protein